MSGRDARLRAPRRRLRSGLSLLELVATLGILGILATLLVPRVAGLVGSGNSSSCQTLKAQIELQSLRWKRSRGAWPAANLADIGADPQYFPTGLPVCPVTGDAYTIDAQGRVQGHTH